MGRQCRVAKDGVRGAGGCSHGTGPYVVDFVDFCLNILLFRSLSHSLALTSSRRFLTASLAPSLKPTLLDHTVDFEGVVASRFRALRDQIWTSQGPQVNSVRQVDV